MLPESFTLSQLSLPLTLPVSLPSQLVAQRPDILAAAAYMHAASAEIGVAIANRLPQFPLTATLGTSPAAIANAFTPYNQFYTLVAGMTAPLFDGGMLKHKQRAAVAQFDNAAALYKQTVITAFENVSDTLRALQTDADQLQAAQTADNAARQSLAIARTQFQAGDIAYLSVLNAEQMYQSAQLALVQAEVQRLTDTAALFQALGGGWWNHGAMAAAKCQVEAKKAAAFCEQKAAKKLLLIWARGGLECHGPRVDKVFSPLFFTKSGLSSSSLRNAARSRPERSGAARIAARTRPHLRRCAAHRYGRTGCSTSSRTEAPCQPAKFSCCTIEPFTV